MLHPHKALPLFDAGIPLQMATFGVFYGLLALIGIIFLEAKVMRDRFPGVNYRTSVIYSAILNIVSTIAGIPLLTVVQSGSLKAGEIVGLFGAAVIAPYYLPGALLGILIAFVITIVVEMVGLILLIKPQPGWKQSLHFSYSANIRSYLVLFLAPTVIYVVLLLLIFLITWAIEAIG